MAARLRVLVADDHRLVRESMEAVLAAEHDVLEGASTLNEVDDAFASRRIDVAIVDLSWRDQGSCLPRISRWKRRQPDSHVVVLTAFDEWMLCQQCLAEGASAFVVKGDGGIDDLRRAIAEVNEGRKYLSPSVTTISACSTTLAGKHLSAGKRRVLALLSEGHTQKQVARALGLQLRTVEDHVRSLKDFFEVQGKDRVDWRAIVATCFGRREGE